MASKLDLESRMTIKKLAERGVRRPAINVAPKAARGPMEHAEFAALVLLVQEWDSIAPWLVEALFDDDAHRMAFVAIAEAEGDLGVALDGAPPDAREVIERAAVADLELDADVEARQLIAAAARRELQQRTAVVDESSIAEDRDARLDLHRLTGGDANDAFAAAESLLGWLHRRTEERTDGVD